MGDCAVVINKIPGGWRGFRSCRVGSCWIQVHTGMILGKDYGIENSSNGGGNYRWY